MELNSPQLKPPSLGKTLAAAVAPPIVDETAKALPNPNNKYQGLTGMLRESDVSHDAVMEAFGRLDSEIKAWEGQAEEMGYGLETVAEGLEGPGEAEEGDYTDGTFLTGLMMDGGAAPEGGESGSAAGGGEAPPEAAAAGEEREAEGEGGEGREAPDPTVALAIELGLDPALLSINSGHLGGDCTAAIKALRFALAHPLVGEDEGLGPKPNWFKSTASVRAKQRERHVPPEPVRPPPSLPPLLDFKATKIASIEDVLAGMKDRLAVVEASLVQQLGQEEEGVGALGVPGALPASTPLGSTPRSPLRTPGSANASAPSRMSPLPGSRGGLRTGGTPPSRHSPVRQATAASSALGYA